MNGVDPMASKYSSITPYNYAFNSPTRFNDMNGADPNQSGPTQYYQMRIVDNFSNYSMDGSFGGGHIYPGSGNNWADQYHSMEFNMATMFTGTFEKYYNVNLNNREDQWNVAQAVATRVSVAEFHPGSGVTPGVWVAGRGFFNAKELIWQAGMMNYTIYKLRQQSAPPVFADAGKIDIPE